MMRPKFLGGDVERMRREFPAENCPIGIGGMMIAAESVAHLLAHPQVIFKPRRLVVDRLYPDLMVMDLRIGACSQVMANGEFPLDALQVNKEIELIYERLLSFRLEGDGQDVHRLLAANLEELKATAQPGMTITLTIRNAARTAVEFRGALLLGDAVIS